MTLSFAQRRPIDGSEGGFKKIAEHGSPFFPGALR